MMLQTRNSFALAFAFAFHKVSALRIEFKIFRADFFPKNNRSAMNILVFGASGRTGHELVKQALDNGHHTTAFVRSPAKLKISHTNLRVFQGDAVSYPMVFEAMKDQDAVFSTMGAASPFKYDATVVHGMFNIVKAMDQSKVDRLVYMSAFNVRASRNNAGLLIRLLGPTLLKSETAGHEAREEIIRQSPLSWTLVRAAGLTNGAHTGQYRSGEVVKANSMRGMISRADVADFMLRVLGNDDYVRKAVMVMY
jgi:putative NADH-flavin reductase